MPKPKYLIEPCFRNNYAHESEFEDFEYYETTDLDKLDTNLLPLFFFTKEGIAYLLPKLIKTGYENYPYFTTMQTNLIADLAIDIKLQQAVLISSTQIQNDLKTWLEFLLFEKNGEIVQYIGESFLFRDLEWLEINLKF